MATPDNPVKQHFPDNQRIVATILDLEQPAARRLVQGTYVETLRGIVSMIDRRGRKRYLFCTDRYKVIITPVSQFFQFTLP